ncbi:D-beta-hydroxybutyrate permease [Klebsiella pneumoniae]|nr:D-beta-hydroxybutyrate permease [Klebsiella pneumoniae]
MSVIIALAALALLMLAAYRGYSVILFAPIAALGAVLLTDPGAVGPAFTGLFMEKMVGFVKLYFPVFLLGAVFGKLIELSGFSRSIVAAAIRILGRRHAIPVIVLGVRPADLRRGVAVCGGLCRLPFRRRTISPERDPQTADPRHRRPRGILVYHGRPARHAADPEYYSHQLLRHQRLRPPGWGLSARCSLSSSVCCGWSVSAAKRRPAAKAMGPTCKMSRRPRMTSICRIR